MSFNFDLNSGEPDFKNLEELLNSQKKLDELLKSQNFKEEKNQKFDRIDFILYSYKNRYNDSFNAELTIENMYRDHLNCYRLYIYKNCRNTKKSKFYSDIFTENKNSKTVNVTTLTVYEIDKVLEEIEKLKNYEFNFSN